MNELNVSSIDFVKINTFANERDLKLWKQQAIAKYCKLKYEEYHKQNELLEKKIKKCNEKIQKAEKEEPKIKSLIEKMGDSIIIASDAIDHLIQRKLDVKNEIISEENRYKQIIEQYSIAYDGEKAALEENNPLYKELKDIGLKVEKREIQNKILNHYAINQRQMIKNKEELKRKILNANVIDFVEAVTCTQKLAAVNQELAEKRIMAQVLIKSYEKRNLKEVHIQSENIMKRNELPKLSLQMNRASEFKIFNSPTVNFSTPVTPTVKNDNKQKIKEMNLLSRLKQRSDERQKIIQQRQTSCLLPPSIKKNKVGNSSNINTTTTNISNKDHTINTVQNIQKRENIKPERNVKVLQNITINNTNDALIKKKAKKRPSNGNANNAIKKKTKKVSFGGCASQEDPIPKHTNDVELNKDEVSPFFTEVSSTVNQFQGTNRQNLFSSEDAASHKHQLESDTSGFIMKELINSNDSANDSFFSIANNTANITDQVQDNTFYWSQPTSQQSIGFSNMLDLF